MYSEFCLWTRLGSAVVINCRVPQLFVLACALTDTPPPAMPASFRLVLYTSPDLTSLEQLPPFFSVPLTAMASVTNACVLPPELIHKILTLVMADSLHTVCTSHNKQPWELNTISTLSAVCFSFHEIVCEIATKALIVQAPPDGTRQVYLRL